jgi:hypothetical protein
MPEPLPLAPNDMLDTLMWRVARTAYALSSGVLAVFAVTYFLRGQLLLMALEAVSVVGMSVGYLAGLRLRRVLVALDSIALVNWLTLLLVAVMSGGLRSPAVVWLVILPPMLMLAHPRLAAVLAGLTVLALGGLYLAHQGDVLPANEVPLLQRVVSGAVITTLCSLFAWHALRWRVRLAEALQTAHEAANELNRRKDRFIASLNHEIRTPVNALLAGVQLVGQPHTSEAERQRLLGAMQQSAEHLLAMVNDVLDHARLEAGEVHLECRPLSLSEVARVSLDMLAAQAGAKRITLTQALAPGLHDHWLGDPLRLRQILLNLLSNAIKFTPEGGQVWLRLAQAGEAGPVQFEIRDNGPGMDADLQARLFRPYEQGDAAITRRFGGTGLGLSISRELLGLMGGTVDVQSTPGQGSTFRVRVPLQRAATATPVVPPADDAPLPPMRVLLVEDHDVNRMVMGALLADLGVHALQAEGGEQALALLQHEAVDVVLMDCQMPGMDGLTATQCWRALERTQARPRLPIVALTGDSLQSARQACLQAGMDDYLSKPVARQDLKATLRRWARPTSA